MNVGSSNDLNDSMLNANNTSMLDVDDLVIDLKMSTSTEMAMDSQRMSILIVKESQIHLSRF